MGTLAVVFGDQLDLNSPLVRSLDPQRDVVLMMEVAAESLHVPSHVQRTVLFLSAMRHFAAALRQRGITVRYIKLDDPDNTHEFSGEVERAVQDLRPARIACVQPGEHRVLAMVESWGGRFGVDVEVLEDDHFITSVDEFARWAEGRRGLTMEYFYRQQRRKTGYLMTGTGADAQPEGGEWNFDKSNRLPFGKDGPKPAPPRPLRFKPDAITLQVIDAVRARFPTMYGAPARPDDFGWPVTREQALEALRDFVEHRLGLFGPYEDAMWTSTPFVYHSLLSPALNLKLLNPRECCEAALAAYRKRRLPLQSVEAFIRQIIGWREFIRGVYWLEGPTYADRNGLNQHGRLPEFYWTGKTDMNCLRECLSQVIETGFGHHIQRLMVTGNFALISGVHPKAISDWYLAMYVDAIDWVTLPNTLGMVMHADRRPGAGAGATGVVGTKPYAASGRYIERMSNYCRDCRYDPGARDGPRACPFTVFYWDFLIRNRQTLAGNQRMSMILKNVDRMKAAERVQITVSAAALRSRLGIDHPAGTDHPSEPASALFTSTRSRSSG